MPPREVVVDLVKDEANKDNTNKIDDLKGHEVCIDNVVYDLTSFDHPGGGTIGLFGGNDVSIQYRMIHPHHNAAQRRKMKVVRHLLPQQQQEELEYTFGSDFERELKREVFKIVPHGQEFATPGYLFRAVLYIALYAYLQYTWFTSNHDTNVTYAFAALFGLAHALIGMNVQHDANHGAISRKHIWLNDLFGFGADWIGNSKWLWQQQHWTHHSYTNHPNKDPDAFSAEPLLLFQEPRFSKRAWFHPYQALYILPALSMYGFSIVFSDSVFSLKHAGAVAAGVKTHSPFYHARRYCAPVLRLLYLYVNVLSPIYNSTDKFNALGHVLIMFVSGSLVLAGLFVVSHNFESSEREPNAANDKDWYRLQVETSCTYGGTVSGWLTGGLNLQIEHHLFPRMSSAWYPTIAPTVRRVCAKHNVKYTYYPYFWQNAISTVKYLNKMGRGSKVHVE